jgi:hypothetical protein
MAAIAGSNGTKVRFNSYITKVNGVSQCICCQRLKHELETVLPELQTAKKIIELLYEETNTSVQHTFYSMEEYFGNKHTTTK